MGGSLRVEEIVMQRTPTKTKMWNNGVVSVDRATLAREAPAVQKRKEEKAVERKREKVQAEQKNKEREVAAQKRKLQREEERQQKCLELERKPAGTAQKRTAREEERKKSQSEKNKKSRKANHFQSSKTTGVVNVPSAMLGEGESEKGDVDKSVNAFEEGKEQSLAQRLGLLEKRCLSSVDNFELKESAYVLMKMHSPDADWLLSHKVEWEVSVGDQMCMEEPGWRGWNLLDKMSGVQLSPAWELNAGVMSEGKI
ncbi:hypothetical protein FGB62_151g06 [Gracilaria domingensis]|nr:hypothetical protein FGB62_151g06 [Gracilaria domingensis]